MLIDLALIDDKLKVLDSDPNGVLLLADEIAITSLLREALVILKCAPVDLIYKDWHDVKNELLKKVPT